MDRRCAPSGLFAKVTTPSPKRSPVPAEFRGQARKFIHRMAAAETMAQEAARDWVEKLRTLYPGRVPKGAMHEIGSKIRIAIGDGNRLLWIEYAKSAQQVRRTVDIRVATGEFGRGSTAQPDHFFYKERDLQVGALIALFGRRKFEWKLSSGEVSVGFHALGRRLERGGLAADRVILEDISLLARWYGVLVVAAFEHFERLGVIPKLPLDLALPSVHAEGAWVGTLDVVESVLENNKKHVTLAIRTFLEPSI